MKYTVLFVASFCSLSAFAHPLLQAATSCNVNKCKIEDNCRCSSTINPISDDQAPQFVAITVSESIVQTLYTNYLQPLFFDRTNPDGSPVGLTFYVPHEYTDYSLVQDLYVRGYEIGDHSITKTPNQTYWRQATPEDLEQEFGGQKQILTTFANIPAEAITGVRTPQLQLEGDISINAYIASDLSYDNSWPTLSNDHLLPYTLDYASTQKCTATIQCPTESHPNFWIAPLTNIKGVDNTECNSLATCLVAGTAQEISDWLFGQLETMRKDNRSPLTLRLDSYWFLFTENSYEGFTMFLDKLTTLDDVYLVTVQDVLAWIKNPVPVSEYKVPDHSGREADCLKVSCRLENEQGQERYMKSCVPCPQVYPWKGNPTGEARKVK